MTRTDAHHETHGSTALQRLFRVVRNWHLLALFSLFVVSAIWLSVRIMRLELQAATNRLVSHSAGASRNLETQFDSLRDDFRVLVSTGAFEAYADDTTHGNRELASVKRFFARYQEIISTVEVLLVNGETILLEIAPGNYLRTSRLKQPLHPIQPGAPSRVTHRDDHLIIEELVPTPESKAIQRVCLHVNHNRFFGEQLASYLMGQSDLWIWSIEDQGKPFLIRNPMKMGCESFSVDKQALQKIDQTLDQGLEGVLEHSILVPSPRSVVSAYTPLLLGGERMGLVFSTDSEVHLGSLHRLSRFLGLIFLGSLVLLGSWFAISFTRIRESERQQAAARLRAEAADRAKSEFVAAMSHEIRTPLNGVLGYADLLMASKLTASQRNHVEVIRNSGGHLLSILNDILDFSKISSGDMNLRQLEFSPMECADDVIDMMSTAADEQGLDLRFEARGQIPPYVIGDPGRLRQILYNLVGNGLKFTHEGSVTVTMEAFDEGNSWRLAFVVSDTGIGIPSGKRSQLFSPFSQLDASNTREYEGTGLGLAICSRLVQKMGGAIDFVSDPGKGSDFHFWIHSGKVDENHSTIEPPLQGRTILIIDPSISCRDSLAGRIRRMGANVISSCDETTAIRQTEGSGHVDLVMISWTETGNEGYQIRSHFSRTQGHAPPMIALTEKGLDTLPPERLFNERMAKPLRLASLARRLIHLMDQSQISGEEPLAPPLEVLVAEDNPVNGSLMMALMEQRGANTTLAENGLDALAAMKEKPFDVVFMDVEMPGLDGIEVTRQFRRFEVSRIIGRTTIVGLSAHAFHENRDLAIQAGMDDYLTKPVVFGELDRVLADATKRKSEETLSAPHRSSHAGISSSPSK